MVAARGQFIPKVAHEVWPPGIHVVFRSLQENSTRRPPFCYTRVHQVRTLRAGRSGVQSQALGCQALLVWVWCGCMLFPVLCKTSSTRWARWHLPSTSTPTRPGTHKRNLIPAGDDGGKYAVLRIVRRYVQYKPHVLLIVPSWHKVSVLSPRRVQCEEHVDTTCIRITPKRVEPGTRGLATAHYFCRRVPYVPDERGCSKWKAAVLSSSLQRTRNNVHPWKPIDDCRAELPSRRNHVYEVRTVRAG